MAWGFETDAEYPALRDHTPPNDDIWVEPRAAAQRDVARAKYAEYLELEVGRL